MHMFCLYKNIIVLVSNIPSPADNSATVGAAVGGVVGAMVGVVAVIAVVVLTVYCFMGARRIGSIDL